MLQLRHQRNHLVSSGPLELLPTSFPEQLLRVIIGCHWSISHVDNLEFQRLVRCLNKDIPIPSSSTITRRLLDRRNEVDQKIRQKLPQSPTKVSLALDCWSAPRREGYLAIKAYWITGDWSMAEALIGFESVHGNHTGVSLGQIVIARLDFFEITSRVIALTTDNASNNNTLTETLNKALSWLQRRLAIQRYDSMTRIPCLAHVIQLAVNELTGKIHITAKESRVSNDWNEEEDLREVDEAGTIEGVAHRVSMVVLW